MSEITLSGKCTSSHGCPGCLQQRVHIPRAVDCGGWSAAETEIVTATHAVKDTETATEIERKGERRGEGAGGEAQVETDFGIWSDQISKST